MTNDSRTTGNTQMSTKSEFQQLYEQIPTGFCTGQCRDCCGPIFLTKWERNRVTKGELLPVPQADSNGVEMCIHLTNGRCDVYDERPLICRLWGACEDLPCHFCGGPEKPLTKDQAKELMKKAEAIGGAIVTWHDNDLEVWAERTLKGLKGAE